MQKAHWCELELGQKRRDAVVSGPRIHASIAVPLEELHGTLDTAQAVGRPPATVVEVGFLPSVHCLIRRLPLRVADKQWCTVDSLSSRHNLHHQDPTGRELNLPPAVAAAANLWPADRFDGDHVLSHLERMSHIHGNHRSEEHTSELQSLRHLVCRLLLEKKKETQST